MSGLSFEGIGNVVGGLMGGVGGGLSRAASSPETYVGAMMGASAGAAAGMTTGGFPAIVTTPGGAVLGGIAGGSKGFVEGFGPGATAGWEAGGDAGKWLDNKIANMTGADQAADKVKTKATAVTCATCANNPCAHLACGAHVPGSKYRGGAHGCMAGKDTKGDGLDSHHMPADSKSPLHKNAGPAIQMEPAPDHYMTASYGRKVDRTPYATQRLLLSRGEVYKAFMLDVADAKRVARRIGDPTKYDAAIIQATAYAECLRQNGIIR